VPEPVHKFSIRPVNGPLKNRCHEKPSSWAGIAVAKITWEGGKTYEKDKCTVVGQFDFGLDEYPVRQCAR
jgi:hypothetical protein